MKTKNLLLLLLFLVSVGMSQAQEAWILHDDFSDNSNDWAVSTNENAALSVVNGHYRFEHTNETSSTLSHIQVDGLKEAPNWEFEVRLRHISGVDDYGYGITFGRVDNDNEYQLLISANGYYRIIRSIDGADQNVKEWTESSYVKQGNYVYNTLRLKQEAGMWTFFLNDNYVHSMRAETLRGDRFGYVVNRKQTIEIDYVYIKPISSSNYYSNNNQYQYQNQNDGDYVFREDFTDNSNGWATYMEANYTTRLQNGHYYFEHRSPDFMQIMPHEVSDFVGSQDWELEAKVRHTAGIDNNGYGILLGRADNDNQIEFMVAGTGFYLIKRMPGSSDAQYLNTGTDNSVWTESTVVNKGSYAYNTFRVVQKDRNWYFYLNGTHIETTPSYPLVGKSIGFLINQNQTIEADYFHIKRPALVVNNYNNNNNNNPGPSIVVYEPAQNRGLNVVKAKTVKVAGKATDTDGIFEVKINGLDAKLLSDGYFSLDVPLAVGENSISIVATDTRRMSTTTVVQISRENDYVVNVDPNQYNNQNQNQQNYSNQKRLALLIGNSEYTSGGSLANPVNDVRSMKTALEQLGFTVLKYENSTQKDMRRAMDEFGQQLAGYDVGLFFYAGHGVQVDGNNYLVPTDAMLKAKADVEYDCVDAARILGKMEASAAKTNIVILDACRDNPFERSWSRSAQGKGLAFMNAPAGSFVAYATSPGNTASDGVGSNGLYTSALLEHIQVPGLTIEEVFKRVRTTVKQKSENKQVPWESTSLEGVFRFK